MKFPGGFFDPHTDLEDNNNFSLEETVLFKYLGAGDYSFYEVPQNFPYQGIETLVIPEKYRAVLADSLYHWANKLPFESVREEDVIARLKDPGFNYSYATVVYVNRFFDQNGYSTQKSRKAFIEQYTNVPWVHCVGSDVFVPREVWSVLTKTFEGKSVRTALWWGTPIESPEEFVERHTPRIMKEYNAKATDFFEFKIGKKTGEKPLFLGVELELENKTDKNLKETNELLKNHCIIKRDRSVSGGLEICSAPATLDVHKEEFGKFFKQFPQGLTPLSNCGMHVHVDKKNLSSFQIGKIVRFVNSKDNTLFMERIAGRKPNNYCNQKDRKVTSHFTSINSFDKYEMVNLRPSNTIEFRIFASTDKFNVFMRNLEFCKAIVEYTAPGAIHSDSLNDLLKHESFENFIKQKRGQYPNLGDFIFGPRKTPAKLEGNNG